MENNNMPKIKCVNCSTTSSCRGRTGKRGHKGPTGAAGPTGSNGAVGPTGVRGSVGIQGPIGSTGANGAQGQVGPTGSTGQQGNVGPTGVGSTGPTGASSNASLFSIGAGVIPQSQPLTGSFSPNPDMNLSVPFIGSRVLLQGTIPLLIAGPDVPSQGYVEIQLNGTTSTSNNLVQHAIYSPAGTGLLLDSFSFSVLDSMSSSKSYSVSARVEVALPNLPITVDIGNFSNSPIQFSAQVFS